MNNPTFLSRASLCVVGLLLATSAAEACASMTASIRSPNGNGTYYQVVNNCGYNVLIHYHGGFDSTGRTRDQNFFVARGRNSQTFIYDPQPRNYRVTRQ